MSCVCCQTMACVPSGQLTVIIFKVVVESFRGLGAAGDRAKGSLYLRSLLRRPLLPGAASASSRPEAAPAPAAHRHPAHVDALASAVYFCSSS